MTREQSQDIRSVTPTICALLSANLPESNQCSAFEEVLFREGFAGVNTVERLLVYNPDAVGRRMVEKYSSEFELVRTTAPIEINLQSMFPPVTPVCFASMYTGANPEVHGIDRYMRPIVKTDSIFDILPKEGKKAAIVANRDCSMDLIFRERNIDYCIEETDQAVIDRTITLIEADKHDLIVSYNLEYDQLLHRTGPESPDCLKAMRKHINSFEELSEACKSKWKDCSWGIVFAPDHGGHDTPETGGGDHGLDVPEDMELIHFWGVNNLSLHRL